MNILLVSTFDKEGGGAIATYRFHKSLRGLVSHSQMIVQKKVSNDPTVHGPVNFYEKIIYLFKSHFDAILLRMYKARKLTIFSLAILPDTLCKKIKKFNPDIVHLFWVGNEFLSVKTITKINQPIVWTLHDMWPFTGGCHYDAECGGYKNSCGRCPSLGSSSNLDLSKLTWIRKYYLWKNIPIKVVATSRWLAEAAKNSSVFKDKDIAIIPNGIDTELYRPISQKNAREILGLPHNKKLIMFSAFGAMTDKRKGGHLLNQALEILINKYHEISNEIEIVVLGSTGGENGEKFPFHVYYMGNFFDELTQVLLYSAVDVVVAPSMQENFSNTVLEALSCGTPVVAFNVGGMPDLIDHQINGYLAEKFSPEDLGDGLFWVLGDDARLLKLSKMARKKVKDCFTLESVTNRYLALYKSILE